MGCSCKDTKGKRSVRLNPMDKNTQHRVMMDNRFYYWSIFILMLPIMIPLVLFLSIKSAITKKPIDLMKIVEYFIKKDKLETALNE